MIEMVDTIWQCTGLAIIFFVIYVIFTFTLPRLKMFQPTKEHAQQLVILIYTPAAVAFGFLIGCIVLVFIDL